MNGSSLVRRTVVILSLTLVADPVASSQVPQSSSESGNRINAEEVKLYGGAHPYMDEPLSDIKKTVPELGGLEPAASQDQLSDLLAKVGARADELLQKVPNLISDEAVREAQWTIARRETSNCIGTGCLHFLAGANKERNQEFSYLILTHSEQDNRLMLAEYRTNRNGKPIPQGTAAPHFQGFIATWLVFTSANQVESRFRYLGQQQTDGHKTFVIGFAQLPGSVESPGRILNEKGSIPMLLQGVAWIDQSDFRIVRLRSDLLASQPQIDFQEQTCKIMFGVVKIVDWELWLPQAVAIELQANGQYLEEQHQYSNYRLYQTKTKVILTPNN
jgi:hypothetical protein